MIRRRTPRAGRRRIGRRCGRRCRKTARCKQRKTDGSYPDPCSGSGAPRQQVPRSGSRPDVPHFPVLPLGRAKRARCIYML